MAEVNELSDPLDDMGENYEKLKSGFERLKAVLNSISEGVIAVDKWNKIIYINDAFSKILNCSKEELVGREIDRVLSGSLLGKVLKTKKKKNVRNRVYTFKNKKINVLCKCLPIFIDGKIAGAVELVKPADYINETHLESTGNFPTFDDIIGSSPAITEAKERARKVAVGDSTVCIEGESGTGKELFARAIHAAGPFAGGPFVAINCGAIPDTLLESELFGYEAGAFTGARQGGKSGKFELADGGTIFLDEIGDMPLYLQAKLLRVLQERRVERVGGLKAKFVRLKVITATNKDLHQMVKDGWFRSDLYYRLHVVPIRIPPLRERKEDIPELARYFLRQCSKRLKKHYKDFTPETLEFMVRHDWPGNVRQLENAIEYACNMEISDMITVDSLPPEIRKGMCSNNCAAPITKENCDRLELKNSAEPLIFENLPGVNLRKQWEDGIARLEKAVLQEGLLRYGKSTQGKKQLAAELKISTATLYRKLKQYQLS